MAIEPLEDRRKALEEQFFRKENERHLAELRAKHEKQEQIAALREVSGIRDESVIEELVRQGVRAESLAALVLVPLVAVAWADHEVTRQERWALLSAAEELGIREGTPNHALLERWLEQQPDWRLLDLWVEYATQLGGRLQTQERDVLADELIGKARDVAKASGGILGIGPRISPEEEEVLKRLRGAFSGEPSQSG